MAEIVNLNKARKQKSKETRKKKAKDNRLAYGRTKAEKTLAKAREDKQNSTLDGKKLDD